MVTFAFGIRHLLEIKRFYEHLLNIPNSDIQTIAWREVVVRIGSIRQENALTSVRNQEDGSMAETQDVPKLDAHDVANRIMRQENYLIALFTKDLLDLRVRLPLPLALKRYIPQKLVTCGPDGESIYLTFGANSLTKALEWNLRYCLLGFIFDERGRVRKEFVKDRGRQGMIESLRHRFMFMGILNAIFSPFIVLYLLMYSFFRYFEEYHKNPSAIGSRGYTPFARWKFREFNELPHVFERRLDESYPAAKQYVDQFPKEITAITMRFVAFISGAFAAVLLLLSVVDPVFLHFEITPDRTVLFYLGVFTSILAVSRGMVPANNQVFDPELLLTEVVGYVHYMPESWEGKLHSQQVHAEFSKMFQMKLAIFAQEITSVILTPLVLLFSLPACAGKVIDFCREFTVHVNGIGYVCSFAVFDFKREGNVKITNPEWQPSDPATSMLLSRIADGDAKSASTLRSSSRSRRSLLRPGIATSSRPSSSANETPFLGTEDERLRHKSQLYETALQRSIMLKGTNVGIKASTSTRSSRLQPMEERPEAEEEDGWETARLGAMPRDADMQESVNEADHGAGMLGLLHQVIKK
ncbi:autophagy protein atg9 [Naganishia friedmannii]|uniref:Autophagy protein atg9 n=1 Tax=Naganishia friedmannii TaxID=89922 RepID=A0ACC2VS54_9TREE|nr:autophagy protein atg9 [Naganishia friedmannii]